MAAQLRGRGVITWATEAVLLGAPIGLTFGDASASAQPQVDRRVLAFPADPGSDGLVPVAVTCPKTGYHVLPPTAPDPDPIATARDVLCNPGNGRGRDPAAGGSP